MPIERITVDDRRVADYRSVREPRLAVERGLFVAEGRTVLRRIVEDGRWTLRSVLVNDAALRDLASIIDAVAPRVPVFVCDTPDFLDVTGYPIHRGCLALVERRAPERLEAIVADTSTVLVMDAVSNPDNVGGLFRSASAFGVGAVLLGPGCGDPLYRKAVRTSMAATLRVPFAHVGDWPAAVAALRAAGFSLLALTPRDPSEPLERFAGAARPGRVALVVGAEGAGLSPAVEAAADARVRIPMVPAVDSLNVVVAASVALYRLTVA